MSASHFKHKNHVGRDLSPVEPEDIGNKIAFTKTLTLGEQITPFVTEIPSFLRQGVHAMCSQTSLIFQYMSHQVWSSWEKVGAVSKRIKNSCSHFFKPPPVFVCLKEKCAWSCAVGRSLIINACGCQKHANYTNVLSYLRPNWAWSNTDVLASFSDKQIGH